MSGSGIKGEADSAGHLMLAHYRKPGAAGTYLEYVCYKTVLPFSCGPGSNITAHNARY